MIAQFIEYGADPNTDTIYEIPKIIDVRKEYEELSTSQNTAGGKTLKNIIGYKRIWTYNTRPMDKNTADEFISVLENNNFDVIEFHNDEMQEGEYVEAYIEVDRIDRDINTDAAFDKGQELRITVRERVVN